MSSNLSQETIKNSLYRIGLEENRFSSQQFLQTFQKSNYLPSKSYSFRQISDWENRYHIQEENNKNKVLQFSNNNQGGQSDFSKFSFLISKRHQLNQQDSQHLTPRKKKLQLSPINVKFHHQKARSLFQKSGPNSPRRVVEENPSSFYESNYEALSLLYQMKTRQKKQTKQSKTEQLPLVLPDFSETKLPKTERVSSIMRLMKKNQQIRVYRQRHHHQKYQIVKLP